jgi:cytochrome P450
MDPATRHERRLLTASRPALPLLLTAGRFAVPIRRVPRLGWLIADPLTARQVLNDPEHFSVLGEGGVGHLWAQVLGDWVYEVFDGSGHHGLRTRTRELFTEDNARILIDRVVGERLTGTARELSAGGVVDVADLARVLVGRIVADLLGITLSKDDDTAYRQIFAAGEELAALALGTTASTRLSPDTVARAREIVARMTGGVAEAWRQGRPDTLLGRCRRLGLDLRETEGLATLLFVAGTGTAASAMARTVALLHDTGEQDRLRAQPELLPDAVREGLRVSTPAPVIGRAVRADVVVAGRELRAGQRVLVLAYTANNAPGGFRLDRGYLPDNRQLWFGAGRHLCLGAPVARAELTALLTALGGTGRAWRVVERGYARRVLVASYSRLRIRLAR